MIRRAIALASLLVVTGGLAGTAFAVDSGNDGRRSICVGTTNDPNQLDGVCVWVPVY